MTRAADAERELPSDDMDPSTCDPVADQPTIVVVIVDDHDTVGLGLKALIETESDIDVVSIVGTCADALSEAERL